MGKVVASAAVSLDGYIAGPNETGFEHLFAWFAGGDHEFATTDPNVRFMLSEADHRYLREFNEDAGVYVVGRRSFDLAGGWGGTRPLGKPVVVVTHDVPEDWVAAHPDAPFRLIWSRMNSPSLEGGDVQRAHSVAPALGSSLWRETMPAKEGSE